MKKIVLTITITLFAIALILTCSTGFAEPKYAAKVPESVLTPDKVETKLLGNLDFIDGRPKEETTNKLYDFIDVSRGVSAFLNGMPAASVYAFLEGLKGVGVEPGDLAITEELLDARGIWLTPNSTTMYMAFEIDVKDGPIVVEVPPAVLGPVDDAYFRWITDIGFTGPDKGKGGKYLFVHRDYEGKIPDGYFVAKSPTFRNLCFFRAFVKNGDLKGTAKMIKPKFRLYPLSKADNPPEQKFHNLSGKKMNTVHANDFGIFEELNAVIQYEPGDAFNPELVGQLASIGIKKGIPFKPDARMKKLLTEAAAIGNGTARAICFAPRKKSVYFYDDRQWNSPFAGMSHEFYNNGERVLDDRIFFHYMATGITPAMAAPKVGKGSAYAFTATDSNGLYLDGGKTYKVTLPSPVPVNRFWSFMVYSTQHRSMLETDQKLAGLDSNNPSVKPNEDGSYTIWFGPKAPKGHEENWIQTMPDKGYCVLLRLYGPLEGWFDKTWKPGDFELFE
jgi:hypothetical protein